VWLAPAVFALVLAGQDQPLRDPRVFRTAIDLIGVTVTVLDRDGRLVKDLPREAFDVFEDSEPQAVTQFASGRVPVSLGILLDTSDSMFGRRIEDARSAVERFVSDLLDPADEFAIVAFNHQPHVVAGWAGDRADLSTALKQLRPSGGTAVYDAIMATLPLIDARHRQRAAMVVISDGADTASDTTLREVRSALLRSDGFVYAVAIDSPDRHAINTAVNPAALREITDQSGGRTETVHGSGELLAALSGIAEELNSQYLLGYTSRRGADGQYHSIRVRVRGTDYRVHARNGYVAPVGRQLQKKTDR
jgi:VWFA-related protein